MCITKAEAEARAASEIARLRALPYADRVALTQSNLRLIREEFRSLPLEANRERATETRFFILLLIEDAVKADRQFSRNERRFLTDVFHGMRMFDFMTLMESHLSDNDYSESAKSYCTEVASAFTEAGRAAVLECVICFLIADRELADAEIAHIVEYAMILK